MAKSSKRRKQDQAKAAHKRAEQARRKARDELALQATLAIRRLLDPQTPPDEVAVLVAQSIPDVVYLAARTAQRRIEAGVEPQDMTEAGRHLLAAYPEDPPVGVLAFAVVSAHAGGQEEEEHRLAARLLDTGRAAGEGAWLDMLDHVIAPWHPDETAEFLEPYLVEHPEDRRAHRVYAHALSAAYRKSNESERASSGPLTRFADRTALAVTREALEAFLEQTPWGQRVRAIATGYLDADEDWQEEGRAGFAALMTEMALLSAEDAEDDDDSLPAEELILQVTEQPPRQTLLEAFAADSRTPKALARRARDWNEYAVYGLWQMESPTADPGVWVRDLVTGVSRYTEFPPGALEGAPPWTTWLGCLLPVDGIWRSTGTGLRLSPAEADAIGEHVDDAVEILAASLAGDPAASIPGKPPIRFGQAGPYGVISEFEESMEDEYAPFISKIVAAVLPDSVAEVLRYRAAPPRMRNTDGDEMVLIEADIAVSGDVTGLLLAHPDFEPGDDHPVPTDADATATRVTWYGKSIPAAQRDAMFAEVRAQFGAAAGPVEVPGEQRWVRGALAVSDGLIRVSVNSRKRLERLLRILSKLGVAPVVASETRVDPAQDMVFGNTAQPHALAGGAGAAPEGWAKAWLDEPVPALQGLTPREAAASADQMDVFRIESLLRQFEYQAGLAEAAGLAGMDVAWLRTELNMEEALDAIE